MIGFLVAGLILGAVARAIKPGKQDLSLLATLGLGVAGTLVGGTIAWLIGSGSIWELNVLGWFLSLGTAILLIGTAEALTSKRHSGAA